MRTAPRRSVLVAALVVAVVLLAGSVGATAVWLHVGSGGVVERLDEGDGSDGWLPDGRWHGPHRHELPGLEEPEPAPSSEPTPTPTGPATDSSPVVPGRPIPIPTAPTR